MQKLGLKLFFGFGFSFIACFVNVIGFYRFAKYYLSFMTGNVVNLSVDLVTNSGGLLLQNGLIILAFILGAGFIDTITAHINGKSTQTILIIELCFLAATIGFTFLNVGWWAAVPLSFLMGIQSVAHIFVNKMDLGKEYVAGNIYSLGETLVDSLMKKTTWSGFRLNLFAIFSYVAGGVIGGLVVPHISMRAALIFVFFSLLILLCVTLATRTPDINAEPEERL